MNACMLLKEFAIITTNKIPLSSLMLYANVTSGVDARMHGRAFLHIMS